MKGHRLGRSSKKNIKDVRRSIKTLIERVLQKSPHDFGIPKYGGKRTAEEQNQLFHKVPRVSWLDGYNKISYHQTGNAFDIFIYDQHGACWDCVEKYKEVADFFKKEFNLMKVDCFFEENEFLYWGGDWKRFKDLPHFEIRISKK